MTQEQTLKDSFDLVSVTYKDLRMILNETNEIQAEWARKSQRANYSLISVEVNKHFFSIVKGGKESKEGRKERKRK